MGGLLATYSLKTTALIILLSWPSHEISSQEWSHFILWNVGQGQWATFSTPSQCIHFDIGGERVCWTCIQKECQNKDNFLLISHGDWDHISFAYQAQRRLKNLCLKNRPTLLKKRQNFFKNFPKCQKNPLKKINFHFQPPFPKKKANDNSHIFGINHFLIPGDSTDKMEKIWLHRLPPSRYKTLILGHHGSRTSTSTELLNALPHLKLAITSSRKKKYGHPHHSVKSRLSRYKVPLISTEHWGTIKLQIKKNSQL